MKPRQLFVLRCGFVLTITLTVLEVVVRVFGYSAPSINDPIYRPFPASSEIPYVYKSNLQHARARGLVMLNTDSLGLRSETSGIRYGPKEKNEYRIAIAGDSVTFGEGVPVASDTFVKVLEAELQKKLTTVDVRTFNYGVSAYSVKEMAATLRYRMFDIDPDLVVMAIVGFDFHLGRTPGVDDSGYLANSALAHAAILPPGPRTVLRKLHFLYLLRDIARLADPTPDALKTVENGELPESYSYIRQFKETADSRGISSLIVLLPMGRLNRFDRISAQLQREDIPFLDLSWLLNEFPHSQFVASRFDPHPSAAVHRKIGQLLAGRLLSSIAGPSSLQ